MTADPPARGTTTPTLELRDLGVSYGEQVVLEGLDMVVHPHEIVGLVGENGAGKSTLLNVLTGTVTHYSGDVVYGGAELRLASPRQASEHGIARVFQDPALVHNLTVFENMFLAREKRFRRAGVLIKGAQVRAAEAAVESLNLRIDVRKRVGDYDIATRQAIEISKACCLAVDASSDHRLVLMDEPTASLTREEIQSLFVTARELKKQASIIFVSHRLTEVLDLCDRVYVLKDGRIMAESRAEELDEESLHELMVGRVRDADFYREAESTPAGEPVLTIDGLSRDGVFEDVDLQVHAGEIVSLVGVIGSGKSILGEAISGLAKPDSGTVTVDATDVTRLGYKGHLRARVAYVPGDRHAKGIVGSMSGLANMTLSSMFDQFSRFGILRRGRERETGQRMYDDLGVFPNELGREASRFSGGNQQKLLLGRAVSREPRVLVLDNPTAGVDAGVKEEIYGLFRKLARRGCAIVVITDDLLEAIGLSDRIAVMKDGRVTRVIDAPFGAKPDEQTVIKHMV